MIPPQYPVGPFQPQPVLSPKRREALVDDLKNAPNALRGVISGLSQEQLDTRYKNWTIRQIVHHLADSHVNSYIRFKWTLTEEKPTIKAYEEGDWAELPDSRLGDVEAPLILLAGLHACWVQLLRTLSEEQFARSFIHPQSGDEFSLNTAVEYYSWHSAHHVGQIAWLRKQHGW